MKAAVAVLQPAIDAAGGGRQSLGKAVAGTVAGDIHEIGKTIVCSMLSAAGFTVTDVGCDVPVETFVQKVKDENADLLLLSALLTTTMPNQQKTIEALKAAGLRDGVEVMIGGAPTTRAWADEIVAPTAMPRTRSRPWPPPRPSSGSAEQEPSPKKRVREGRRRVSAAAPRAYG